MNKKGQITLGVIVILIMGIVACLAILPEIFTQQTEMTTKNNVVNETIDISTARITGNYTINSTIDILITNVPTGWKVNDCPIESVSVINGSGTTLTANTDYNFTDSTGAIRYFYTAASNMSGTSNTTFISYTYCLDGYNKDSGSRGIGRLIGLITVIGLFAWVASYGLKNWLNK